MHNPQMFLDFSALSRYNTDKKRTIGLAAAFAALFWLCGRGVPCSLRERKWHHHLFVLLLLFSVSLRLPPRFSAPFSAFLRLPRRSFFFLSASARTSTGQGKEPLPARKIHVSMLYIQSVNSNHTVFRVLRSFPAARYLLLCLLCAFFRYYHTACESFTVQPTHA